MESKQAPPTDAERQLQRLAARLRFRHAQLLVTLRDTGSLHAAAAVLSLTQPALSKMLREIEQAFGQKLFERGARGLSPTPAGLIAMHGAMLLLEELDRLGRELATQPSRMVLRVGTPPFVALSLLPPVLRTLSTLSSNLHVELTEGGVPSLVRSLLDGKLDALVTSLVSDLSQVVAAGGTFERLYTTTFTIVATASHPLAGKRQVSVESLAREHWILPPRDSRIRHVIDDMFAEVGQITPTPIVESANPLTNLLFVSQGLGIAAVPQECLTLIKTPVQIVSLRLRKRIPEGVVTLVYRKGGDHPRLKLFRQALMQSRESGLQTTS